MADIQKIKPIKPIKPMKKQRQTKRVGAKKVLSPSKTKKK